MVKTISASEAKNKFGALIRRITRGRGYVIVEKDGIPVIGIMPAEELKRYLERRKVDKRFKKKG